MQRSQRAHRPELWIATKQRLSAEDAVKCFALGATGLGVDAICNDYLWNGSRAELSVEKWTRQVRGFARSCGAEALGDLRPAHLLPV